MTYTFGHSLPQPGVNPANYKLYRATASCGQSGLGWQEVPAAVNLVDKTVVATISQGGTYALFQPDVIFKDGFQ